ncbi:uncharacterized protein N7515_009581 [Penicillium bovifimosum]|uniref:Uncharacterized protein n=1 Tax=Penicillium bovifimosum TaxID=126998 RepID=A0A9W9GJK3_9EURO|nr:uncharacterized protein N7515_009581 [Penicillium bovifimosum]KAJ5121620.1 hypothetical protein N7515_009581 [Penicillium bovifimosum]
MTNSPIPRLVSSRHSPRKSSKHTKSTKEHFIRRASLHHRFKDTFYDIADEVLEHCQMWERAGQIQFYLEVFESYSERKRSEDHSPSHQTLTLTGAKAEENELLHGDLAHIANALYCSLEQPQFENTSLFPGLVISFFGPRHGRLLQATFDNPGTLIVRPSLIYNFIDSDEKIELFVRYDNCEPRDGPEIESVLVDEVAISSRSASSLALRIKQRNHF